MKQLYVVMIRIVVSGEPLVKVILLVTAYLISILRRIYLLLTRSLSKTYAFILQLHGLNVHFIMPLLLCHISQI